MRERRKSPIDSLSEQRAVETFRDDPDAALAGSQLSSAETCSGGNESAVIVLAEEQPERFLELIGYLPHAIQDIFLQYYFLGRTQTQIAETLGMTQSPGVWQALRLGIEAICAVIAFGGPPGPGTPANHPLAVAYQTMLDWQTKPEMRETKVIRTPRNLGEFEINAEDVNLMEFFAPGTEHGPVGC